MKPAGTQAQEVTVGKNESGNYEYKDTGRAVNTGDKAYMVKNEDIFSGSVNKVFFESKEKANMFN